MKSLSNFNRSHQLATLEDGTCWDVIVIGGGATGLGVAVDAAARGFATLLLEQADFAQGTSSRSTKLVHGGVRYLAQGDIKLVYQALKERGLLLKNAPHLVSMQDFIIPCYTYADKFKYLAGLTIYDWLAGRLKFKSSGWLSRDEVIRLIPEIKEANLLGGVRYYDGQFDDARLALNLAQTCVEQGGAVLNYCKVTALKKASGKINGVIAEDVETGRRYDLTAKVVVNATGVFVDDILALDDARRKPLICPSQGVHIVLPGAFLHSSSALMIPKTTDGRVLFAIPWNNHLLAGTTDTRIQETSLHPIPLQEEIDFILETLGRFTKVPPRRQEVLSVFAGLRPLAASGRSGELTREISRGHKLMITPSGLLTITGGKWTTYRKMAEETVDKAIKIGLLPHVSSPTSRTHIHGWLKDPAQSSLAVYGADATGIGRLMAENTDMKKKLVDGFDHTNAEVVWAVRHEMARTIEDVLARRLRILFVDAKSAMAAAPRVAELMREELKFAEEWKTRQVADFTALANQYLIKPDESEKTALLADTVSDHLPIRHG